MPVSEARDHVQGPADAAVTLVEYGDYECPYCGAAYPIIKEVQARMGERLRFVFRNFPIATSHPHAEQAAEAAEAAAAQGRFWEMHDLLYENQKRLRDQDLRGYAEQLALDVDLFDKRAGRARARSARPRGLHERRAQRRERHADLLYQRCEARRFVRPRDLLAALERVARVTGNLDPNAAAVATLLAASATTTNVTSGVGREHSRTRL